MFPRFFLVASCFFVSVLSFGESATISPVENPCELPIDKGPCKAKVPRYAYDPVSWLCVGFDYGGCEGNANNFETLEACQNRCEDVCEKPIDSGTCYKYEERFAYNEESGQCQMFVYGGCGGNGNNFLTKADCEGKCVKQ